MTVRKITDVLFETGLARSKGEATRMVKQGQIRVGGCGLECSGWSGCLCLGWTRVLDPQKDLSDARGQAIRVGTGDWQCKPKLDDGGRFNQFPGIARIF